MSTGVAMAEALKEELAYLARRKQQAEALEAARDVLAFIGGHADGLDMLIGLERRGWTVVKKAEADAVARCATAVAALEEIRDAAEDWRREDDVTNCSVDPGKGYDDIAATAENAIEQAGRR